MAKVSVILPAVLDRLPEAVEDAARSALLAACEEGVSGAKAAAPVNTGTMRRGLYPLPVEKVGTSLKSGIAVSGTAAQYGPTMEGGRRAGARGPSVRHLLFAPGSRGASWGDEAAQRGGWVNRRMRAEVEALAAKLAAEDAAFPKLQRKGKRPSAARRRLRFLQKARFLIAQGVAEAVHTRGIRAREFALGQARRVHARFTELFHVALRRRLER